MKIPTPMEFQIGLDCPQGLDDTNIPTPTELQIDLDRPQEEKMISKFPPPWNIKLTSTFHKDKMISKFQPPWNLKLTWAV